jgi:polyphosphate kinase
VATTQTEKKAPAAPNRLLNRELSFLDFIERVLELSSDPALPLLERVMFLSIFSNHLDEFFAVRVAGLMGQAAAGGSIRSPDGRTPQETLASIRERVLAFNEEQSRIWRDELRPALALEGIVIGRVSDCTDKELAELAERFEREIYPVLTPLAVGPGQPFPYISALSLSLGVFVRDPNSGESRFARVKVPELLPRFIPVGRRGLFLAVEHVISHSLTALFPKMEIAECDSFRVTRDADFEVSDEADDLLEAVEFELQRRRFGSAVRVEVSDAMSPEMLARLKAGLGASDQQVYPVEGLLDLADLSEIAALDRPDLKYDPWRPATQPRLAFDDSSGGSDLFEEIQRGDILVQLPYESFGTSVEAFVRAAARDPDVIAIKTTVYRTSDD